mmetsp:Transcript_38427/g.75050  ORF Transcript_38427/g.75050 Transcript_38427/m.75050 type:complete len:225 (+) Transcript_38427:870-1544(+)
MTPVRELALAAGLDGKLLEGPHVVHDDVEQPHLVAETHQEVQARGVQRERVRLLVEVFCELERLVDIVPHPDALVQPARSHERLADACVDPGDLSRVEGRGEEVKVGLVGLHDVGVCEVELVQLVVVRRHDELLLGVRHGEVPDLDGVVVDAKHLCALVKLLLVRLVVDRNAAIITPRDDTLREAHNRLDRVGVRGGPRHKRLELQRVNDQQIPRVGAHHHPLL